MDQYPETEFQDNFILNGQEEKLIGLNELQHTGWLYVLTLIWNPILAIYLYFRVYRLLHNPPNKGEEKTLLNRQYHLSELLEDAYQQLRPIFVIRK